jgi:hypothetical protein
VDQFESQALGLGVEAAREQCHPAGMTETAPEAGWVVQVTVPAPPPSPDEKWRPNRGGGAPSFKYFNVAIADAKKAVEAAIKHLAETGQTDMRVVRGLSSGEIAALSLTAGQIKPA